MISIKSKSLQEELGVKTVRGARSKLVRDFGIRIIDNEYIDYQELERAWKAKHAPAAQQKIKDWIPGSSFEDLNK